MFAFFISEETFRENCAVQGQTNLYYCSVWRAAFKVFTSSLKKLPRLKGNLLRLNY